MAYLLEWFASLSWPLLKHQLRAVHVGVSIMHYFVFVHHGLCVNVILFRIPAQPSTRRPDATPAMPASSDWPQPDDCVPTCTAMVFHSRLHTWDRPTNLQAYKEARTQHWPQGTTPAENLCGFKEGLAQPVISVSKLQALVYDILPSTTAVFSYAIGPRKLSSNEQFFVGAQTVVSLLQTTQIKQRRAIYSRQQFTPAQMKPQSFESWRNSFFRPGWMRLMFTWVLGR